MRYGSILSGMAAAALIMASSLGSASDSVRQLSQAIGPDHIPFPNMSGHYGHSHWRGHKGQFSKALGKRRGANVLARKARRTERLHRHTSTGRRLMEQQSA